MFAPEELVGKLDGQFGLVWDGDSIETCSGAYGAYLRYNSPHKASLYLAAGLPLIVWKESALASYVKEKGVGLCIGSLSGLGSILGRLTEDEYAGMLDNVARERKKIVHGEYLASALKRLSPVQEGAR